MRFRRGVRVGRILGVELRLDPSWFFVAVLFAWLLARGFATGVPKVGGGSAAALGIMGSVLFFASVLAHELSHAVVAVRKGIPVPRITLFIFGGMAHISQEPKTPGDEAKIALAGPALSGVLGVVLIGLGLAAEAAGGLAGAALFETIGVINLLMAVFNLLPGFPLDGGRVLRAAVWRLTGDLTRATRIAAFSGRLVGGGLMGTGIALTAYRQNPLNGLWLVMVGLFLYQAATAAYRHAADTRGVAAPTVADLMTRQPEWVPADLQVDDGLHARLLAARDRAFPVVSHAGRIEGILTLEGLQAVGRDRWAQLRVTDLMHPMAPAMVAGAGEATASVVSRLDNNAAGRFVVLDGGWLVGMFTPLVAGTSEPGRPVGHPAAQGG